MTSISRYSRQVVLPEIGKKGQTALGDARILCVGAGGLGCPALLYLAAAGVGKIGIVDFDRVDVSNLQRQILFNTEDEGKSKAAVARDKLIRLNPEITINAYDEELTDKNVIGLFSDYDIILDGTDNFPAKFLINDAAVKLGKPVIYAAIQGFEAQVSVFGRHDGPCYRCLHPQPPASTIMNCAEAGVVGAVAGIAGTVQAAEAIKLVVGNDSFKGLSGRLWILDARTMETSVIAIPRQENCAVCARPRSEITPVYASPVCMATIPRQLSCQDLTGINDCIFIDVRERDEWDAGHMPGAHHLPLSALQHDPELYSQFRYKQSLLYCQRGLRSQKAAELLLAAGFSDIATLEGGYEAWCAHN